MSCFCGKAITKRLDKDWPSRVTLKASAKSMPVLLNGALGITLRDDSCPMICCLVLAETFWQVTQLLHTEQTSLLEMEERAIEGLRASC